MKRILGIDPGTNVMGYAIISCDKKKVELIKSGVLYMEYLDSHYAKLKQIHERLEQIIISYQPHEMAIEAPFFGKNVQSMLKLGRAQGIAIALGLTQNLEVTEYSPKKIKVAITGNGNASKEQVNGMLSRIFKMELDKHFLDASDALATALCHHYQLLSPLASKQGKYKDWKSFLKNNPDKLK